MQSSNSGSLLYRGLKFLRKPFKAKVESLRYHACRLHEKILKDRFVTLVRLPGGPLAFAWPDFVGSVLKRGDHERNERLFVQNFLKPGMTVLDVGAHQGYYSLLAAQILRNEGYIVAFEPSTRQRRKLRLNLMLNGFGFVKVEASAVGSEEGTSDFFVVQGKDTGCNSMRPPSVKEPVVKKSVRVLTLDQYLTSHSMKSVDFLKMDVEGAELSVLNGAKKLIATKPRPVILCEVDDIRTTPWNYKALEIYDFLLNAGFEWFSCDNDGLLFPFPRQEEFHGNLIAVPSERRSTISNLLTSKRTSELDGEFTERPSVFDAPQSIAINIARLEHLESLHLPIEGKTVLDVGCGPGHLANFFVKKGCDVLSIDGRKDNIDRLKHLYPSLKAMVVNIEKDSIENLGKFQIVFCYGLLYHLENPYSTVQKLSQVCDELLLLETMVCDYDRPLLLIATEPLLADQALSGIACRPSPSYVTLILTQAGFPYVYSPVRYPAYPDFQFERKNNLESSREGKNLRCIFVASKTKLENKHVVKCSVP